MKETAYNSFLYYQNSLIPIGTFGSFEEARTFARLERTTIVGDTGLCVTEQIDSTDFCLWTEGILWKNEDKFSDSNEIIDEWLRIAIVYKESQKINRFELMDMDE